MDSIVEGEDVIFQHGIGLGPLDEALVEREGERVFFELNGVLLEPVFYRGLFYSAPNFFSDQGRVLWTPESGTYTVQSWWSHPNEGPPPDECTFTVQSAP
jgi:hypothetical protein